MKHTPKAALAKEKIYYRRVVKNGNTLSIAMTKELKGWNFVKVTVNKQDENTLHVTIQRLDNQSD